MSKKSKIKIISEKVSQPFKEIPKSEQGLEDSLEEIENPEEDFQDFSDFISDSSGDFVAPSLEITNQVQFTEPLEETAAGAPNSKKSEGREEVNYDASEAGKYSEEAQYEKNYDSSKYDDSVAAMEKDMERRELVTPLIKNMDFNLQDDGRVLNLGHLQRGMERQEAGGATHKRDSRYDVGAREERKKKRGFTPLDN